MLNRGGRPESCGPHFGWRDPPRRCLHHGMQVTAQSLPGLVQVHRLSTTLRQGSRGYLSKNPGALPDSGFPNTRQILETDAAALRTAGLSRNKILAVKDLAQKKLGGYLVSLADRAANQLTANGRLRAPRPPIARFRRSGKWLPRWRYSRGCFPMGPAPRCR